MENSENKRLVLYIAFALTAAVIILLGIFVSMGARRVAESERAAIEHDFEVYETIFDETVPASDSIKE